jgi:acyl-coenzyme A synthetase/AMP-(fatty) acid ligase
LSSLFELSRRSGRADRDIVSADGTLRLADFVEATGLEGRREDLADRAVVLFVGDQLKSAAALIELDGLARRIVVCPPDLDPKLLGVIARAAEADTIVHDAATEPPADFARAIPYRLPLRSAAAPPERRAATEWIMLTSGTTGAPKLVQHDLKTLAGPFIDAPPPPQNWGTFYDIRRYGGLQIFLRAIAGSGGLTLAGVHEPLEAFLDRLADRGVTHMSGTPSHGRRLLMSSAGKRFAPDYVRLSGEIADAGVLAGLRERFPRASIGHAYASTEAGVAFEVVDEQAGFPASFLTERDNRVAMRIVDGSLRIRSPRTAHRYIGPDAPTLLDSEGYVDSGDMIETRDGRCHFVGRFNGVINVGGAKVHPEEVEAVINRQAGVRMSLVKGRRNPIAGALVVADVVLNDGAPQETLVRERILTACRAELAPHKTPAVIRFVPKLAMTTAGKLARNG